MNNVERVSTNVPAIYGFRLSDGAAKVLDYLVRIDRSFENFPPDVWVWISHVEMARDLDMPVQAFRRHLKTLKDHRLVFVERRRMSKTHVRTYYSFAEQLVPRRAKSPVAAVHFKTRTSPSRVIEVPMSTYVYYNFR